MKPILLFLYFILAIFEAKTQGLSVGSYNIRFDNPRDSGNLWQERKAAVASLVRYHDFDFFGTQEGLVHQLEDLQAMLPGFAWYGKGRDDGQRKGEFAAIFYDSRRFILRDSGTFWLSETPDKPGHGWDANLNRVCSWVRLKEKKGKLDFFVFNAHFDHQGIKAREESSKLILDKIRAIAAGNPVILTGDFNGDHESTWYKTLAESAILKDTYRMAAEPYALNGSFNSFNPDRVGKGIIDHVFVSHHFSVQKWAILTDTYFGKFPSDHFPVKVEVSLGKRKESN